MGRSEQDVLSISLGSDGAAMIRNNAAVPVQLVLDVIGYFLAGTPADYGSYQPIAPTLRVLDGRRDDQTRVWPGISESLLPACAGSAAPQGEQPGCAGSAAGPVPGWGLAAVVARVSIIAPSYAGSLSVYRSDRAWNGSASISFPAGVSVQQQLTVPLGQDQQLTLLAHSLAEVTVVIDVLGYYRGLPNPLHQTASAQFEPAQGHQLDVSCASPTFCMTIEQYGRVEIWNGSAWSAPVLVPQASSLGSVSCVSASFCVAAGWADHNSHIELFGFDGSSWSALTSMAYQKRQFPRIFCPSVGFCMATGDGSYRTFDGSSWSAEQPFGSQYLLSLSCPSASFCVAVDRPGQIYTFNGNDWTGPDSIPGMTSPQSVSCTSASFCLAVVPPLPTATYDGTSWTPTGQVGPGIRLRSVSCASNTNCRAVSDTGSVSSLDGTAWSPRYYNLTMLYAVISCAAAGSCAVVGGVFADQAFTFDGTSWSQPKGIGLAPGGAAAVSCTSASFCMAADIAGYLVSYDGTDWGTPVLVNGGRSQLDDVSCAAVDSCVAVDDQGNAYHYDGASWSNPAAVDPGQRLQAVSCAGPSLCVAVGWDGKAATFNGSSWTTPVTVTDSVLFGVSCPSSTLCLAVGQAGAAVFNGTSWSAVQPTGTSQLNTVSCASSTFCLATGYGQAARWDSGSWSPIETATGGYFSGLSCPGAQLCEAAVPSDTLPAGIIAFNGSESTMSVDVPASEAISCPTSSFCMALAGQEAYQLSS